MPLNVHPMAVIEEPILLAVVAFEWVGLRVESFHYVVGISCEAIEGELMVLLTAIEVIGYQNGLASLSTCLSRLVTRR
jgi:hypothetical protein